MNDDLHLDINVLYNEKANYDDVVTVEAFFFNNLNVDLNISISFDVESNHPYEMIERVPIGQSCPSQSSREKNVMIKRHKGTKASFQFMPKKDGVFKLKVHAVDGYYGRKCEAQRVIKFVSKGILEMYIERFITNLENYAYKADLYFGDCDSLYVTVHGDIASNAFKFDENFR